MKNKVQKSQVVIVQYKHGGYNHNDNSALRVSDILKMADNSPLSVENCFMTATDSGFKGHVLLP